MHTHEETAIACKPCFAISDEAITRIASTRARQCNSMASELGQKERLKASCLIDMYHQCGGVCNYCTTTLTEDNIQLDHIIETRYRAARRAMLSGSSIEAGKIACLDNVQWLCALCNELKERFRARGVDLVEWANAVKGQADLAFPVRRNCVHLGTTGAREFREKAITEEVKANPHVTAKRMCELLEGTPGEASYACVMQCMKERGWQPERRGEVAKNRRIAIVKQMFDSGRTEWESESVLCDALNDEYGIDDAFSKACWRSSMYSAGVSFSVNTSRHYARKERARMCAGDKQACLLVISQHGDVGAISSQIENDCVSRGVPKHLIADVLNVLKAEFRVYESQDGGRLFASLTRKEAASRIGLKANRLKKFASKAFAHKNMGPPFMKVSEKADTFYRRDDVEHFARNREKTAFDLCGADGTHAGGKLGGRPKQRLFA
jgi:hypothetical protein